MALVLSVCAGAAALPLDELMDSPLADKVFGAARVGTLQEVFKRGERELSANRPLEAEKLYLEVLSVDPKDWEAHERLVQIYQALGMEQKRDAELEALRGLFLTGLAWRSYISREQFKYRDKVVHALEIFGFEAPGRRVIIFQVAEAGTGRYVGTVMVRRNRYPLPGGRVGADPSDSARYELLISWQSGWRSTLVADHKPDYAEMRLLVTRILDRL